MKTHKSASTATKTVSFLKLNSANSSSSTAANGQDSQLLIACGQIKPQESPPSRSSSQIVINGGGRSSGLARLVLLLASVALSAIAESFLNRLVHLKQTSRGPRQQPPKKTKSNQSRDSNFYVNHSLPPHKVSFPFNQKLKNFQPFFLSLSLFFHFSDLCRLLRKTCNAIKTMRYV